ncbi:NACHT domain-containing protein [Prolixibacteraceae bacterium Z1-6]|uniref:NACHT domain-containing protein n=1 Tax=Draconibacterium aestuarii TaxID=2998507 RepID=A0A9X3J4V7_9BACT|nr:NACHT domain-containing protein [Prolixibacteraceae bacterium Z1-6]
MQKQVSEAPESNAGDDFHVLWTIKKTFDLLNFEDNGLKAITIEGIDPKNAVKIDPYGNKLLGVDIAEYFGGESFKDSQKVIISQLKYSTRRVTENWTLAKLYAGKKSGSTDGSVLHRLAQIFKTFLDEYGRDLVLKKLRLKFISNRNINSDQKKLILDVQDFLKGREARTNAKTVFNFSSKEEVLKKIYAATKLSSTEFTDFLRLLDFEDCGTESSYYQELEIIEALRNVGVQNVNQSDSLFRMVWRKMLPEAISLKKNKITEIDLLHCLNMSMERLFPVSQKFEKIEKIVDRKQIPNLIKDINSNETGKPICLHGGAGIGKSTITQLIKQNFSNESEVILFDCYGSGSYLNTSDSRHLHREAILQISNEIAKKIGSPYLLSNESESYILVREFKRRVEDAISILRKRNSTSLLVLIIDAADNSVTAAQKDKTRSFIRDLVNESYSDGFRLVVTSRSHRVDSLGLPEGCKKIPIDPFDIEETEKHLKFSYPDSTKKETMDFHHLTNGIPRVQSYALELKRKGIKQVINYLKPNGKQVEDLIQERINESARRLGNNGETIIDTFFSSLISLPRPVPLAYISALSDLSEDVLLDLSTDIWHGLVLNDNQFSFRDEDFENYIRERYKTDEVILQRIADLFLHKANEDDYASINLGISLFDARYHERLKNVVLDEEYKSLPKDPIRNKEVYIKRTKLAMKVCSEEDDNLTFFKLAFIAADAAKTDAALNGLLIENADLVASFGESDSLQRLYAESEEKTWSGSFYYQLAAIYSRQVNSAELATRYLKTASKWLEWRNRQKDIDEPRHYQITDSDIANGAEAHLRVFGSQAAFDWLNGWRPKEAVFRATSVLLNNILRYSKEKQIQEWIKPLRLPIHAKLILLDKLKFSENIPFDLDIVYDSVSHLLSKGIKFKIYMMPLILSFCEIYLRKSPSNNDKVIELLKFIDVQLPDHVPTLMDSSYRDDKEKVSIDSSLRKYSLNALLSKSHLELEDIYPERYKKPDKEESYDSRRYREDEKRKFNQFYSHALSIYKLRTDVLENNNEGDALQRFQEICEKIKGDWELRHYDNHWAQYKLNFLALVIIDILPFFKHDEKLINSIVQSFENKNQNRISLRISIAQKLSKLKVHIKSIYQLLNEVDELIENSTLTSSEMVDFYIRSAKIIRNIDKDASKYYLDKAIDAVAEIDIEAQEQIKCLYNLSQSGLPKTNPRLAFEFARFVEFCEGRLSGYDNFPIEEGIKGISNLDCASSFAILCRWTHRNKIKITEHILSVLQVSIEKDFISPNIGASLLPLNIYYWKSYTKYIKALIQRFDDTGDSKQKSIFVQNILRDISINCSPFEKRETVETIFETIKDGRLIDREVLQNFKKYHQFISNLNEEKDDENDSIKKIYKKDATNQELEKVDLSKIDIYSTSSLNSAISKIKSTNEYFYVRAEISQFLNDVKQTCTPQNYVHHLDAFLDVNPELLSFYTFEDALKDRLEEWSFHPLVKQWKKDNFEKALKIWFSNFNWNEGIYYAGIRKFADIFSIEDSELGTIIFTILPEKIEELSATAIYETISFLKTYLNSEENEDLIAWILPKWNSKIKDTFADGIWTDNYMPSRNPEEVVAQTLRFCLGHPDKRIRWRGMHSLRRIVNSDNSSILGVFLNNQNKKSCLPHQHNSYMFFWISAKLYLWICIERLSLEKPSLISQFKDEIYEELHNKDLPHVLILYFIKQTCLNLIENNKTLFTEGEITTINQLLMSQMKSIKEERYQRKQRKYNSQQNTWKFDFDTMDTLPYWYDGLARCFNLSEYDVADLADKIISEEWGYSGNCNNDHVQGDWHLTSNRHGSLPTIENMRSYYEYHAMFCVASKLLEKEPLLEREEDYWGTWDYWLDSQTLTLEEFWLADLRDPIPLERKFWVKEFDNFDEDWKNNIDDNYYDKIVGYKAESEPIVIPVYGGYTRYFGENNESISIRSAIVTPQTSESLLRALQTAKDNLDFTIPLEDDELKTEEDKFKLIGWLKENHSEHDGLDQKDPFSRGESKSFIVLGNEVEKLHQIEYSMDYKHAFYKNENVFEYQNWSDENDRKHYDSFESSGAMAKIKVNFLLEFLKKRSMDLILGCTISRRLKERDYDSGLKRKNETKLFLIKTNGEVKTIRGINYKIG